MILRFGKTVILAVVMYFGLPLSAHAVMAPPIADVCIGCTTWAQLQTKATNSGRAHALATFGGNPGEVRSFHVSVTSDIAPISGVFLITQRWHHISGHPMGTINEPLTLTQADAEVLDQQIFSKGIPPIEIPTDVGGSANGALYEDVNTYIRENFPIQLLGGYKIYDPRAGVFFPIKQGDIIVVTFADGSSAKMKLKNPLSSLAWELVPGSERDANGQPYSGPVTSSHGTPRQFTHPVTGVTYIVRPPSFLSCWHEHTITNGVAVTVRAEQLPCHHL